MNANKILPIIELITCIQGEGKYVGIPHILIRFTGCPLRCQFEGSLCDTLYSSWNAETGHYTLDDINTIVNANPTINHTMITGGSPTMHPKILKEVVSLLKHWGHFVTIETEGSHFVETEADFISLSPKLSNSTPKLGAEFAFKNRGVVVSQRMINNHEFMRKSYSNMMLMIKHHNDFQVKYVISTKQDITEVHQVNELLQIKNNKVYLMAEGIDSSDIKVRANWLIDECIYYGFNYTPRLHIDIFGNERNH